MNVSFLIVLDLLQPLVDDMDAIHDSLNILHLDLQLLDVRIDVTPLRSHLVC